MVSFGEGWRFFWFDFLGNDAAKLLQQWGPMEIAKCVPNSDRVAQIADLLQNLGQIQSFAVARFLSDAEIDTARRLFKQFAEKIEVKMGGMGWRNSFSVSLPR